MKGINNYGFIDKDNVEDIIGFIRKNYNSFNVLVIHLKDLLIIKLIIV